MGRSCLGLKLRTRDANVAAMWLRKRQAAKAIIPAQGEIEQARQTPGGWVYRIAGTFGPDDRVPPEAIMGAWKVNERGEIEGDFAKNPNYDSSRFF